MDPTVAGALIGAGGAAVVAVAGFLTNARNTSVTSEVSRRAVEAAQSSAEAAQRTAEAAQRTAELNEQGQVTDRYTKAIEQLGSDKLDVRIGGIYALERIARDSPRDHHTITEVLAAFIRDHSHEQWPPAEDAAEPPARTTRPDVLAAATVIGRRSSEMEEQLNLDGAILVHADLSIMHFKNADLTRANLSSANLSGIVLSGAVLNYATLTGAFGPGADLSFALLVGADLTGAKLEYPNLGNAKLPRATLTGAKLPRAHLASANLTDANLASANLTGANLNSADLMGVDFHSTDLTDTDLTNARWPSAAVIPGWKRDIYSGRLQRVDANPGGAPSGPGSTI